MSKKRTFPDNWSRLSDKQVMEIIKYLRCNYKKHDIKVHNNYVQIDNVKIQPCIRPKIDAPFKVVYSVADIEVCIEINNRSFVAGNGAVFQDLQQLKQDCVRHYRCRQNWNKYGEKTLLAIISAALASAVAVGYVKYQQLEKAKPSSDAMTPKATAERTTNTVKFIEFLNQRQK